MGVVRVLSRPRHAVHPAECSLEHEWLSIQQNAVECVYSLEHIEAVFSFTKREHRYGEVCGMFIMGVIGMLCRQEHAVFLAE